MAASVPLAAVLVASVAGCESTTAPVTPTTTRTSTTSGHPSDTYVPKAGTVGETLPGGRTYLLRAGSGAETRPLVVVLPIAGHSAAFAEAASGFSTLGDKDGFAVAYGQGVGGFWNAGGCCGATRADDVGYLRSLVRDVEQRVSIDRHRVYVTGDSNGGMMAERAVCEAPGLFAAAGVVGSVLMSGVQCAHTIVHIFEIHSFGDTSVPLKGGRGIFGIDYPAQSSEQQRVAPGSVIRLYTYVGGHGYPSFATEMLWAWLSKQSLP